MLDDVVVSDISELIKETPKKDPVKVEEEQQFQSPKVTNSPPKEAQAPVEKVKVKEKEEVEEEVKEEPPKSPE